MDLTIEWIDDDHLAMAHYDEQNGDLMADPDMELFVDIDKKEILPTTYQNDYVGVFQEVYLDNNQWRPKLSRELSSFLNTWLKNIEFQGHVLTKAVYYEEDMAVNPIVFDENGQEYGFDVPHDLFSVAKLTPDIAAQDRSKNKEYSIGTIIRTHFKDRASTSFIITKITEDTIYYILPDILEQESVTINREIFEKYLQSGEFTINTYQPTVSQNIIDTVLRGGGNEQNSITRIIAHYTKNKSSEDNSNFLKKEFSRDDNGKGYIVDGEKYAVWFESGGIRIAKGDTALHNSKFISYERADECIKKLLQTGNFAAQDKIDAAPDFERQETAQRLWYFWRDVAEDYKSNYIANIITGSFPDDTAKLAELFQDPQKLRTIVNAAAELKNKHINNPDVMRFKIYNPADVLQALQDLQLKRLQFNSNDDVTYPQMFITQDEIDNLLVKHGSSVAKGKYRIYGFFLNNNDRKERISFLKKEYGIGGMGYTGFSERHDAKGIVFQREHDMTVYDTVKLTWSNVTKRIDSLIESGRYMSQKELKSIPKYERSHIAAEVYSFYYHLPEEEARPYTYGEEHAKAIENIEKQLEVSENIPSILDNMSKVIAKTPNTDRDFERMEKAYIATQEYANGTFSLFGKTSPIKEIVIEPHVEPDTEKSINKKINYHITDDGLGTGGAKTKYKQNIDAIKLLKTIEDEDRTATADEQEVLAQYVGWGGLAKAFDETDSSWSNEYSELKSLLDETEYKAARASTLNAHYTSPVVIKAIYKAIENMGFTGGNILEPSCGVGNFLGLFSPALSDSKMYGVELDSISGRIAQQLYQCENIQVTGFEHTAFHDNFFDVAIGNVPFGSYGVADKKYDKHNFMIHDYFFAKALDKVRPGGIVAFITSKGTLDKQNSNVRKYLAQRAELVGAIRLPNNAFKANAGTEVTSDIVFLIKRDSLQDIEPDWVQIGKTQNDVPINQYFIDNPHMVLGEMRFWKGMYGNENETACIPYENADLQQQLDEAISNIEAEIDDGYMVDEPDIEDMSIPADPNVKNYSFTIVDDKLYYRENSRMNLYETNATAEKRIKAMIALSTTLHTLIDYQLEGYGEHAIKNIQIELDSQYDDFVMAFGRIDDRANRLAFSDDSAYYLLSSLENFDEDRKFLNKADIFTKQTIRPRKIITHIDTSAEALAVSIGNKAKVDIGYMSTLTGKTSEIIIEELKGVIFKNPLSDLDNPYDGFVMADEYLSGNVRDKLKTAKLTAEIHPEFAHHVPALEAVQPEDLEAGDIEVKLGTVWIPTKYIEEFMFELLDTSYYGKRNIKVEYSKHSGSWYVSNKSMEGNNIATRETYGTHRINAYQIVEETLNQKTVRITDKIIHPDGKEEYVLNKKETFLATQKQNLIKEAFKDWIFRDEARRKYLVDYYNENFNNIRPREYNGEHLTFEGMNPEIMLRTHQINAVARQLYGGNSLLAHVVGAGKSFTMIAAAMEGKRLGLSSKNMITVPNHLTEQIAAETLRLYPSAKVLVTTKKDFQKHNRKRFCSKISTGDYDIIVIGHSQFEKVPLSIERQIKTIQKEIDDITYAISCEKGYGPVSYNVKQMERTKKVLKPGWKSSMTSREKMMLLHLRNSV